MVDGESAVQFGQRRDEEGAECVTQDVDGDDEGGQFFVGGGEFAHYFWDAGCEHGGCEGSVVLVSLVKDEDRWGRGTVREEGDGGDDGNVRPLQLLGPVDRVGWIVGSIPRHDIRIDRLCWLGCSHFFVCGWSPLCASFEVVVFLRVYLGGGSRRRLFAMYRFLLIRW